MITKILQELNFHSLHLLEKLNLPALTINAGFLLSLISKKVKPVNLHRIRLQSDAMINSAVSLEEEQIDWTIKVSI